MIKQVNGKNITIPEKTIAQFCKSLDISEEEAIQMYLDDNGYTTNETVEALSKKAKENKTDKIIVQSKVEKAKTPRKPKENPLKSAIITDIYKFLAQNSTIYNLKIENPTKIITFSAENRQFKLDLVEKRVKK